MYRDYLHASSLCLLVLFIFSVVVFLSTVAVLFDDVLVGPEPFVRCRCFGVFIIIIIISSFFFLVCLANGIGYGRRVYVKPVAFFIWVFPVLCTCIFLSLFSSLSSSLCLFPPCCISSFSRTAIPQPPSFPTRARRYC